MTQATLYYGNTSAVMYGISGSKAPAAAAHLAHFSCFQRRVLQTTQNRDFHTGGFTPHLSLPVKTKQFRKCAAHSSPATQSHRKCTDEWKTIAAELGGFYCLATQQPMHCRPRAGALHWTQVSARQPFRMQVFSTNSGTSAAYQCLCLHWRVD